MEFILTSLGNAKGEVSVEGNVNKTIDLRPEKEQLHILETDLSDLIGLSFSSEQGKLADSEDSLLFFGIKVDPSSENFRVSGTFCLKQAEHISSRLSGFGVFAIDTLSSENNGCRYRNMISAGVHRSVRFNEYTRGIRIVSGYKDPEAETGGSVRALDASRECVGIPNPTDLLSGATLHIELRKTNNGFDASLSSNGRTERLSFPGCDFLMQQDETAIYAGFGVAGGVHITVSDICVQRMPGNASHTPAEELKNNVPDYPFDRALVDIDSVKRQPSRQRIVVSPTGSPLNSGDEDSPLDFKTALSSVADGGMIILEDGVYCSDTSFIAPKRDCDTDNSVILVCARNDKGAILDGTCLNSNLPVMIIAGDNWQFKGIVFRGGKGPGLFICGNNNKIELCEAYDNEDSGFLICTFPGTTKDDWPCNNLIVSCTSHNNCDPAESNADGFGAKLSVGEGNRFVRSSAYHNIDDGFDFYSKTTLGPIGAVTVENCIAYRNGYLSGEKEHRKYSRGVGFKLGGENQPVRHTVRNCVAYDNAQAGFSTNSNPLTQMENLLSWNNGLHPSESNYVLKSESEPDWLCSNLWTEKSWRNPRPVLMFLVPRTSGGGAEKIITSLASQMTEKFKVYLVTTVKEDGVRGYDYSDDIEYINIYERFHEKNVKQGKHNHVETLISNLKTLFG
ncbi:MAG: right-handed parallel beta-helix repeat-containing protein, partial [Oscillospiraceae bacterium]|nr:right-handed parallel beta-helix repeat-containing protein [Oscillospiraceae bacterium]